MIQPFKLERFFSIHEFTAKYLLCSSDCESMTIGSLLAMEPGAGERFVDQWLGYTEKEGSLSLRRDISNLYQGIGVEDLLVCSGAQEPIYLFSHAALSIGDEAIFQFPCYQPVQSIPESLGCQTIKWRVRYENGVPSFDLNDLEALITARTKVIFLNTPHNPTGFHFSTKEQIELIEIARKNHILIFSDEVYSGLEHVPKFQIPPIADLYEFGISLGVMSKAYGLPGLRIGWVASHQSELLEKMEILKEYTTICNSAPSEFLASVALRNRTEVLTRNLNIVKENLTLLEIFFKKYNGLFAWFRPNAGPIGWVEIKFNTNDMQLVESLLKEKNVLLLPGQVYDYPGYFRIGFGRKNMPEALSKFEEFIVENLV